MSIEALSWAWKQHDAPLTAKLVLIALADHADHEGVCWPGQRGLGEKCGVSRQAVNRAMRKLEELGLITRVARHREDGGRSVDLVRLVLAPPVTEADTPCNGSIPTPGYPKVTAEPSTKNQETSYEVSPDVSRLCNRLALKIRLNDPRADVNPCSVRWTTDMRLLLRDRQGDVAEVERVIDWCQQDPFWAVNVLSPGKLRKQFTALVQRANAEAPGKPDGSKFAYFDKAAGL